MAELTADAYQGILVRHPDAQLWEDESVYSEADPRPGTPQPQQASRMRLDAAGTMVQTGGSDDDEDIVVATTRGGLPGGECAARFGWRWESDSDDELRGWDGPYTLSGVTMLAAASTPPGFVISDLYPGQAVVLSDGTLVQTYEDVYENTGSGLTVGRVRVGILDPQSHDITLVTVLSDAQIPAGGGTDFHPGISVDDDDVLTVYYWTLTDGQLQIGMSFSDDGGATWTQATRSAWKGQPGIDRGTSTGEIIPRRLRAVHRRGQHLVAAAIRVAAVDSDGASSPYNATQDRILQFIATDGGHHLELVGDADLVEGHVLGGYPDLVATSQGFLLAYIESPETTAQARLVGSAADPLASAEALAPTLDLEGNAEFTVDGTYTGTGRLSLGGCAVAIAPSGMLVWYLLGFTAAGTDQWWGLILQSADGESWEVVGEGDNTPGYGEWSNHGHEDNRPDEYAVAWVQGRAIMAARVTSTNGAGDDAVRLWAFGGSVTVELPQLDGSDDLVRAVMWRHTGLALDAPSTMTSYPYTLTTALGGTETYQSADGSVELFAGTAGDAYLARGLSADLNPVIARRLVIVDEGGVATQRRIYAQVRCAEVGEGYTAAAYLSTTGIALFDQVLGTQIGSTLSVDLTVGTEILLAVLPDGAGAAVAVLWACPLGFGPDRKYTLVASGALSDDGGAGGTNVRFEFGIRTSGHAPDARARWFAWCDVWGTLAGRGLGDDYSNPDDLRGRPYDPAPQHVASQVNIMASGGRTYREQQWVVPLQHDHGIDGLDSDSPTLEWRAAGTSQVKLAWRFDREHGVGVDLGSPLLGIFLPRFNAARVDIDIDDGGGGGWINLGFADRLDARSGLPGLRRGPTLAVDTGSTPATPVTLLPGELREGYAVLDATTMRKVATNTGGRWTDDPHAHPVVRLVEVDGGDPASGNFAFMGRDLLVLIQPQGVIQGIRLTMVAASGYPAPPEDYWKAGGAIVGPVHLFSQRWDWGWESPLAAPGTELRETRTGQRYAKVRAPLQRTLAFGWPRDLVGWAGPLDSDPDHYLVGGATSEPILSGADVQQLEEIFTTTYGPAQPLVCIRHIPQTSDRVAVVDRPAHILHGRIVSEIPTQHVSGNELHCERSRITRVTITEER